MLDIARLYICNNEVLTVPHISSTEKHNECCFRESKESLHNTCRRFGRCVAKNTCTQQNNLTFLQNCLGSDYSSIAEKERKKRHQLMKGWMLSIIIQARLRSTVTEGRMLSLITGCPGIGGTLSGYFALKAQDSGLWLSSAECSRAPFSISQASASYVRPQWNRIKTCLDNFCLSLPDQWQQTSRLTCKFYFWVLYYKVWV